MALRWHPNRLNSQPRLSAIAIFQLLDTNGALASELCFDASRTICPWSRPGGLRAASINLCNGSVVANEGTTNTRIEVSALADNSLIVRVNDTDRVTLTGVTGATITTHQRSLRPGIDHCDDTSSGPVTISHGSLATSQPPGSAHERRAAN